MASYTFRIKSKLLKYGKKKKKIFGLAPADFSGLNT